MTTISYNTQQNVVKDLRKIRDQINDEIKDMTFEEERAYLDKLLKGEGKSSIDKIITTNKADTEQHQQ
ncbi:MAG: hypothetical protein JST21_13015 [Bacteroidetes bacterium]|nr:hypothetical protein [Bacteroidota bacterium]